MNLNAPLWHQELFRAPSAEDVVATVQDYLVLWRPDELALLPEPCDASRLLQPPEVSAYAAALLSHGSETARRQGPREALTVFFAVAARRLSELDAGAEARSEPEPEAARI